MSALTKQTQSRRRPPKPRRPRRSAGRRARLKAETRERILQSALGLFQKKGFDGTTTKEIARKARVAEGTIFNYFRTKEDIALYFFEKEAAHVIAYFERDTRLKRAPIEEKLFALIQRQLEYIAPYQRFIGSAIVQALQPSS